jgi:hypothetical protein
MQVERQRMQHLEQHHAEVLAEQHAKLDARLWAAEEASRLSSAETEAVRRRLLAQVADREEEVCVPEAAPVQHLRNH